MEIMFQTIGRCQLNCKTCAYEWLDIGREAQLRHMEMNMPQFRWFAKQFLDYGYDTFQLTPIIGEPLLDKTLLNKIIFLSEDTRVKRISFFTNFLTNYCRDKIKTLLSIPKLTITISIYGYDEETYKENTGSNKWLFRIFLKNMEFLAENYKQDSVPIEFFIRCPEWEKAPQNNRIRQIVSILSRVKPPSTDYYKTNHIVDFRWNGNWCGLVPNDTFYNQAKVTKRNGICQYALIDNSIDTTGDIILCGACDVEKKTIIGNLYKQRLDQIYKKNGSIHGILYLQNKGIYIGCCKGCSEHHPVEEKTMKEYKEKWKWLRSIK